MRPLLGLSLTLALIAQTSFAQDVTTLWKAHQKDSGIDFVQRSGSPQQRYIVEVKSTGAALVDYDSDGLLDIFLTAGSDLERYREGKPGFGCRLYRNLGAFKFEDVTSTAGIPSTGWASGCAAADVDDDGDTDLLITCVGRDRLLLNQGGTFTDAPDCGFVSKEWSAGAAFGDLDGDGDLDLYVSGYLHFDFSNPPLHGQGSSCLWKKHEVVCGPRGMKACADRVYENLGNGKFQEVSKAWGFHSVTAQYGLGVIIANFVGDARPDIFVANDSCPNFLFENQGSTFEEVGFLTGVGFNEDGLEQAGMGVDVIDLDGNGHLDLIVTNFEEERNNLYMNSGRGTFIDRADSYGLGLISSRALSWGVGFEDFNNDGSPDLYVANGHVYKQADLVEGNLGYAQRDHLFLSRFVTSGDSKRLRFEEQGEKLGWSERHVSRGCAFGDLDNDGDIDALVCHLNDTPVVLENVTPRTQRSVQLLLSQPGKNREALGAHVEIRFGPHQVSRIVKRHSSFQCSNDPRVHIGIGTDKTTEGVAQVTWPDGGQEEFTIRPGSNAIARGQGKALPKKR